MNDSQEHRRLRLAESIAWCSLQKLQNNPPESDEIKRRRALAERATNHAFAAHQLEAASPFKWVTRGKVNRMKEEASRMFTKARLGEIRPLSEQLRSPQIKPELGITNRQPDTARAEIVEKLCELRSRALRESGHTVALGSVNTLGGKILRYTPDYNFEDVAPAYASKGFFDDYSCPPWDTWICCADPEIISYVPRLLCGLAQRGIEVDPTDCIRSADDNFILSVFGPLQS